VINTGDVNTGTRQNLLFPNLGARVVAPRMWNPSVGSALGSRCVWIADGLRAPKSQTHRLNSQPRPANQPPLAPPTHRLRTLLQNGLQ
jgi:hypothetical protein